MEPSPSTIEPLELSWTDVELGKLLGEGTFASVYAVSAIIGEPKSGEGCERLEESKTEKSSTELDARNSSRNGPSRSGSSRGLLVLKFCRKTQAVNLAGECLIKEAAVLSGLPVHPNVIRLLGVSTNLAGDPAKGFLLLQRVSLVLDEMLKRWKIRSLSSSFSRDESPWNPLYCMGNQKKERMHDQQSRIQQVCVGVARAMAFLHSHGILYRDLKPSNVGLDYDGQARLFDFGLARTFNQDDDQGRLLTRFTGSLRYMAPEVDGVEGCYGFSADVYSFAILLWQVITLRTPFQQLKTVKRLKKAVHVRNHRPSLSLVAASDMQRLLKASWHRNPDMRPTFALIVHQLELGQSEKTFFL